MKTKKNKDKKKLLIIILLLLLLLLGSFFVIFKFYTDECEDCNKLGIDDNINIGDISGLSEEEIQEMLDSKVAYNYVNINMNTSISVGNGDEILNLNLNNSGNKYDGFKYNTTEKNGLLQ